ncbi:hypothetical protein [Wenjunlia tyrosinilytica]|uniref:Uncharacterized protein n=1 Tax=Wenjunlia tyrosinilytica TaxID=1544741 RepID=A0A918E1L8_9ACTN|nr:hypothetical protein [Wenjunlia tyrosinilytica]GGO98126.1 hypothetical protein GCM10012280_61530 [Wenjunlia tyrosinilytica]
MDRITTALLGGTLPMLIMFLGLVVNKRRRVRHTLRTLMRDTLRTAMTSPSPDLSRAAANAYAALIPRAPRRTRAAHLAILGHARARITALETPPPSPRRPGRVQRVINALKA